MTSENHHGQPNGDDSSIVTFAGLPVNYILGDTTEIEYESALKATWPEHAQQARDAD